MKLVRVTTFLLAAAIASTANRQWAAPPPRPQLQGQVRLGATPFGHARIFILAPATNPEQHGESTSLVNEDRGRLDSSDGPTHGFRYVLADANGMFSLNQVFHCRPGQEVYLYVRGTEETEGKVSDLVVGELAVLGACPSAGSFTPKYTRIVVNELTTVAAAYALSPFATDAARVWAAEPTALRSSLAEAQTLVDVRTGAAAGADPQPVEPTTSMLLVHTIGNILHACTAAVTASDPVPATCSALLTGGRSEETASALLHLLQHAEASQTAALYPLSLEAPVFSPALDRPPSTLQLPH